ncbi:SDR family NAD(P)-dependent oxidoreductase [Lederbergia panacisoli]|uniref:SDR family NAD(P)-dependent oxidoreductase n=1 Tax=Lederbergia panacisoli TaxID=1255251 RepID=UPI00214BA093|nr:SDR family NAD(P)-dependent oxidoreductase [Lederbergia panacisoli]MCR2823016.1 SDR family oxidoreductase [Lederbergia panacisoli]
METYESSKTVLVTGASRGIGKGIALKMASHGYDVAITYRSEKEEAEEVAHSIEKDYGRKCIIFQADLSDEDTAKKLVGKTIEEFRYLNVLVNNAGLTIKSTLAEMEIEKINFLLNLNLKAPFLLMREAVRHMKEEKISGNIINIASTRGKRAYPDDAVYGGTKAALIRATESVALECAPYGIRVNCIAPGATRVRAGNDQFYEKLGNKIPLKRLGTPEDIGQAAAWLVSDQASYITGETIKIDGGLILPGMPEDVSPEAGYGWGNM